MKELTIKIPEGKLEFFMELLKELGFEAAESMEISEQQKAIVRERIKTGKAENFSPWDEARKEFNFKSKV